MAENQRPAGAGPRVGHGVNNATTGLSLATTTNASPTKRTAPTTEGRKIDFTALNAGKEKNKNKKTAMARRRSNVVYEPSMDDLDVDMDGDDFTHAPEERQEGVIFPQQEGRETTVEAEDQYQQQDDPDREVAQQAQQQRMQLISPPPEDVLVHMRRVSSGGSGGRLNLTATATPGRAASSTPAAPGTSSRTAGGSSKRKRQKGTTAVSNATVTEPTARTEDATQPPEAVEATPNPKPRKQRHVRMQSVDGDVEMESPTKGTFGRRRGTSREGDEEGTTLTTPTKPKKKVVIKSPHVRNPEADWIPDAVLSETTPERGEDDELALTPPKNPNVRRIVLSSRGSRRSATPIPPYEPPTDVFTPPREVVVSPPAVESGRRGSVGPSARKGKGKKVGLRVSTVQVKQEIPDDIDLRAPMPPPSPTDDPLLLSGPPEPPVEDRVQPAVQYDDDVLPPSSPELDSDDAQAVQAFDWDRRDEPLGSTEDSMMHLDPGDAAVEPVRLFEDTAAGGWSDSDDEVVGEGEYTGRFRILKVRTKQDPPSSATRSRQDLWGRPVSPFPKIKKLDLLLENDDSEEEREVHQMSLEPEEEVQLPVPEVDSEEEVHQMSIEPEPAVPEEDDDDSSDTDEEPGLIKITSADPRAAARAVAILKQHDYDCYTKLVKRQRRQSHSAADDLAKESRRRGVASAGVHKSEKKTRRSTMGVVGDRVYIPGTPVMTLPELLVEVEKEVATPAKVERDPFKTPLPDRFRTPFLQTYEKRGEREWTKEEWKLLDACFTDQRLELGSLGSLASVDDVAVEDVVARFVDLVGGWGMVDSFGDAWVRDNLLERTRALQRKQRSGNVAPPTTPYTPYNFASPSVSRPFASTFPVTSSSLAPVTPGFGSKRPSMQVPDFTPLPLGQLNRGRAPPVPRRRSSLGGASILPSDTEKQSWTRPVLPPPVVDGAPFGELPTERERRRVPPTLLNPRYSHLLEEAMEVCRDEPVEAQQRDEEPVGDTSQETQEVDPDTSHSTDQSTLIPLSKPHSLQGLRQPSTLSTRVKGFFTSYLPVLSSKSSSTTAHLRKPRQPGLPLPPPDVLSKPRGAVSTPARPAIPRVVPPKELVELHPAPLPEPVQETRKKEPKRLVELVHVEPPVELDVVRKQETRPRRSSASSVRDLVGAFERMEEESVKGGGVRKIRTGKGSVEDLKKAWKAGQPDTRPRWR